MHELAERAAVSWPVLGQRPVQPIHLALEKRFEAIGGGVHASDGAGARPVAARTGAVALAAALRTLAAGQQLLVAPGRGGLSAADLDRVVRLRTQLLGLPDTTTRAARTLRRWLLSVPGSLTRHARGWTLHLPARWPWHGDYLAALARIRALPAAA